MMNGLMALPFYNEILWLCMLLFNFVAILLIYRAMGKLGLYIWLPIACIIANIQVVKLVPLFGFEAVTLGNIVYATSFLATDILSENYGKEDARRAVFIGFIAIAAMTGLMNLALFFKPAADDFAQSSFQTIFSLMPRIALGSFAAYWVSQIHDVWAYNFWKRKKPETKFIWFRNNLSTMVSQLIDTLVFTTIAFWGVYPFRDFLIILVSAYLIKVIVAAADTPLVYIARRWFDNDKIREIAV
jgi:uncharacterized integral membrane protein (TIGR00697 family)